MLSGLCSNYDIMMLSCLYYALIMMLQRLTCLCRCFDYDFMMIIIYMKLLCLCDYHAVVVIRFIYFIKKHIVDCNTWYDVICMMWYMGTHPWCDLFCDFMWWKEIRLIIWTSYWFNIVMNACCIVVTYRVQGLCDSQACDAKYDSIHILKRALIAKWWYDTTYQ